MLCRDVCNVYHTCKLNMYHVKEEKDRNSRSFKYSESAKPTLTGNDFQKQAVKRQKAFSSRHRLNFLKEKDKIDLAPWIQTPVRQVLQARHGRAHPSLPEDLQDPAFLGTLSLLALLRDIAVFQGSDRLLEKILSLW